LALRKEFGERAEVWGANAALLIFASNIAAGGSVRAASIFSNCAGER
jgi:hypothetical protein